MPHLIGTDEAGYGPNLGPLVITASVWQVPDGAGPDDLYRLLDGVIAARPGRAHDRRRDVFRTMAVEHVSNVPGTMESRPTHCFHRAREASSPCMVIADSKIVYQPGKGLAALEQSVLTALALLGRKPATWRDVWDGLARDSFGPCCALPWYGDYDAPVPLEAEQAAVERLAEFVDQGLRAAGVQLVALRSRAIFEAEFNQLVERHGSKGTVLSRATLELAARAMAWLPDGPIAVLCDKHGGRNSYEQLLSEQFPDRVIEVYGEGREESRYQFGPAERRIEFRFRAHGETCLATALASMTSKYLRELAMRALNAFWCGRVAGLAPTAGYPADAKRFKAAIAAAQARLGIADQLVWRSR